MFQKILISVTPQLKNGKWSRIPVRRVYPLNGTLKETAEDLCNEVINLSRRRSKKYFIEAFALREDGSPAGCCNFIKEVA